MFLSDKGPTLETLYYIELITIHISSTPTFLYTRFFLMYISSTCTVHPHPLSTLPPLSPHTLPTPGLYLLPQHL